MTIQEDFSEVAKETWLEYSQKLKNNWIEDLYHSANSVWVIRVTSELFNGTLQDIRIRACKQALVCFGPKFDTSVLLQSVNPNILKANRIAMISITEDKLCIALGTETETEMWISFKDYEVLSLVI